MNWKPIETLPDECRAVLLYYPKEAGRRMAPPESIRAGRVFDWPNRKPTHWMPLPEPPK